MNEEELKAEWKKNMDYQQIQEAMSSILVRMNPGNLEPVSDAAVGTFSAMALGLQQAFSLDAIDPSTVISTPGKITFMYITEPDNQPVLVTISAKEM